MQEILREITPQELEQIEKETKELNRMCKLYSQSLYNADLTKAEDVTFKYYDMLNSFRADNTIKINEVEKNKIAFDKSFFEIEKDLIKNKNKRYFRDIDLLEELEFELRHENLKIVSVNKNLKEKDILNQEMDRLINLNKQLVEECQRLEDEETRLNNIIDELESYLEQQWLEWKYDYNDEIVAMANEDKNVLDKLKELKGG